MRRSTAGPRPDSPGAEFPAVERLVPFDGTVEAEGGYSWLHAKGVVWDADTAAEQASFSKTLFTEVTLAGGNWTGSAMSDVRFQESRFLRTDLSRSRWRGVEVGGGIASGVQWPDADIRRTVFRGGKFDLVNFRGATLADVVFEDCLLREADFAGAAMTRVRFPGCVFERVDFSGVKLAEVDLRGARLHFARGLGSLRGATIDPVQLIDLAPALAGHLGIAVAAEEPAA
jgi:uncharacterized protein YjbI with pentapeptide repeats